MKPSAAIAPQLAFRPAGEDDLPAVRALATDIWRRCYADLLPAGQVDHMLAAMYGVEELRRNLRDGIRIELIELAGEAIGYLAFGRVSTEGQVHLHKLYLLPEHHARGIGQAALAHVLASAARSGAEAVSLRVNKGNARAIRAYQKAGFETIGALCQDIGGGFVMDDFVMRRTTAPSTPAAPSSASCPPASAASFQTMNLTCYLAGTPITGTPLLTIRSPYDGSVSGTVTQAGRAHTEAAIAAAVAFRDTPTRYQRSEILEKTRTALEARREEFARTISSEAGLALREGRYEVGRTIDVLRFAAMEALRDDGQIFSCDISAQGKARKIFTTREPLRCAVAITPFNHPLNQVAHKLGPAIAAGTPIILKPSEKTPLVAVKFAELLYAAGLPGPMLSVLLGPTAEVAEVLVKHPDVEVVAFTGSVPVGKRIAATAGYKKLVLELGGNDPLIVLDDADLDLAVTLAAEGSYRNSGQRCTAVKRILVQDGIAAEFTRRLVEKTREYVCGDPLDEATKVGTVIDEASAISLETVLQEAVAAGAKVLIGGGRRGALFQPTVIADVPRDCRMVVAESFGPLAPILTVRDLDDALTLANSTAYGLSSGVVTNNLQSALKAIRTLRCGTVNINEVPGFRVENSPFGGIKDSGLGIKEGVIEAIKGYSYVKTFSLPW